MVRVWRLARLRALGRDQQKAWREKRHSTAELDRPDPSDYPNAVARGIPRVTGGVALPALSATLDATLSRPRYGRRAGHSEGRDLTTAVVTGHRHGSRVRTLMGTFGKTDIAVPRARLNISGGKTTEWKSRVLRNYQRRTRAADALIAGAYLAGTNTRRVRRAL